jgi:hypothetical protein
MKKKKEEKGKIITEKLENKQTIFVLRDLRQIWLTKKG